MSARPLLLVTGVAVMLAGLAVQAVRVGGEPIPAWALPLLWLATLICLSGGAWVIVKARDPQGPLTSVHRRQRR